MKNKNQHIFLPLAFIGIVSGILFFPSFLVYFVQDDFFLLKISHTNNIADFFRFFIPLQEVPWYRPLSSQVFFWLGRLMFGLNPLPFHIVVFVTHISTSVLLYALVKATTKRSCPAAVSAFLYTTNGLHLIALSWLAAYSFVLGTFLEIGILLLYIKKYYWWTFMTFIVGLAVTEVHVVLPIALVLYHGLKKEKVPVLRLIPFITLSAVLLLVRFVIYPPTTVSLYQLSFLGIASTVKFYTVQALGFPMLLMSMPLYLFIPTVVSGLYFFTFLGRGLLSIVKNIRHQPWWFFFFGSIGIIYTIPFLLLPNHIAPHYLSFTLVGISVVFAYLLEQATRNFPPFVLLSILGFFVLFQFVNVRWTYQTHWLFARARLSQKLVEEKNLVHPIGSEEYFSLGANEAAVVFK